MDKIRLGIPAYDESKLDVMTSNSDIVSIMNLISEPLVRQYDGKIWPALANIWQVFEKGRRWLFYIPPGTMFSDSTPCTMIDVMETIENVKKTNTEHGILSRYGDYLKNFNFSILNRYALQVTCEQPSGDLGEILSSISILKANRNGKRVIGTGNYKYSTYYADRSVRLNKLSNIKHLSAYEQITFFIIPDSGKRLEALHNGEIHFAADLDDFPENKDDPAIEYWTCKTNQSVMCLLNGFNSPFKQPNARRAINLAVDVDRIIREVLGGYAFPATSIVSPYHCGYSSLQDPIPYDPVLARKLFAQAEIDRELVISAVKGKPKHAFMIADMIADMLNDAGVKVRVDKYEDISEYYQRLFNRELGDIMLAQTANSSTFRILFDAISSRTAGPYWQGIEDKPLDDMIEEANRECDITDRERKYGRVITYLNKNPHWLYLYHPLTKYARRADIKDVESLHTGALRFPGAW